MKPPGSILLAAGLFLFAALQIPQACCSEIGFISRSWQTDHGLPHNSVGAVIQSSDGYIWTATSEGLSRFDGVRFKTFNGENTPILKGISVRFFYRTADGTLWIGTESHGLITYRSGEFQRAEWLLEKRTRTMFQARDGSLWIGTAAGLVHYSNGKLEWLTSREGLPNDIVLALCEDSQGNLWIGTNNGLVRYNKGFHEVYRRGSGLNSNSIRTLVCDRQGNLWIGTNGGGLSRFRDGQFAHFNKQSGLPDDFVWTMCEDSRGQLWIGTYGGLCRRIGDRFEFENNSEGASYEMVFCITEDRDKNIWIGTKEGLAQLNHRLFEAYTKKNGLSHNNAIALCEDINGRMLISTWGGGLNTLQNGQCISYNQTNNLPYDVLLSVYQARDGTVWLGTDYDGGIYQMRGTNFVNFGREFGIVDNAIRVFQEDRSGTLWVGSSGGLYAYREGKFRRFTKNDGLPDNTIRALYEDSRGRLWVGTARGLVLVKGDRFVTFGKNHFLEHAHIISILEDRDKTLWLSTSGAGICRLIPAGSESSTSVGFLSGEIKTYTTKEGLFNDSVFEILEDDFGYFWMSSFSGVFRVRKEDFAAFDRKASPAIRSIVFGKFDGMSSIQCNGIAKPAAWKSRDGRLWFPTTRGVVVVNPKDIESTDDPLPVMVEEVFADKRDVSAFLRRKQSNPAQIEPGQSEMEFHYTALGFRSPETSRFKYKLEGLDADWVDAGNRRVAFYNRLDPGPYTFKVLASDNRGGWNRADFAFVILPHIWQTRWFLAANLIGAVAVVAAAARYLTWKRVQRQLRRMEQEHAVERERARIARDMHDDLGVRLTELLLIGDCAAKADAGVDHTKSLVRKMTGSIREIVDSLDAIVWAVNPQNDTLGRFIPYISEYVQTFLERTSIRFTFDIADDIPDRPLSSEIRHNLYMVIRETLNNVVKHSGASTLEFRLRMQNEALQIEIGDDGKGFDPCHESCFGNGIQNMSKRVSSMGGTFQIKSSAGAGTRIRVVVSVIAKK